MKKLLGAVLFILSGSAHAGLLTGVIIGSALSGGSSSQKSDSVVLKSDVQGHDIITCPIHNGECDNDIHAFRWVQPDCAMCANRPPEKDYSWSVSPELYAGAAGYKHIHAQGRVVSGKEVYIWMEVSK